MLQELISKLN